MSLQIDTIDERILYYLSQEARHTSAPDIAKKVDVSAPTVRNRIRRLEEAGVIRGYHADITSAVRGLVTEQKWPNGSSMSLA